MICALSCLSVGLIAGFYIGCFWEHSQEFKRKEIKGPVHG